MPLIPRNLSRRLVDRLQRTLAPAFGREREVKPAPSPPPGHSHSRKTPALDPGMLDYLVDGATSSGSLTVGELQRRIGICARNGLIARALYNGQWRDLEPVSYRMRDKDDAGIPLLYAYCHKDQQIEAFKLKKFNGFQVTRTPYRVPGEVLNTRGNNAGPFPVEIT